jgi:hypothetical protein
MSIDSIASIVKISRSTLLLWAKQGCWEPFPRNFSARTNYRNAAADLLGRPLKKGEHVHHIDGDITNNAHDNLHVYPNATEHTLAHGSLEKCAFLLVRQGLIQFDRVTGRYHLRPL